MSGPDPVAVIAQLGGCATTRQLRGAGARARDVGAAVQEGRLVRARRGRYRLSSLQTHAAIAHRMSAVLSHRSACVQRGWPVKQDPEWPEVVVPRNRNVSAEDQREALVRWRHLGDADAEDGVTTPLRTALDCGRDLPFDEALAVADSALRSGQVDRSRLLEAARVARGAGTRQLRRVALLADGRAANPFESVLRAICLEEGLDVVCQHQVVAHGLWAQADLVDTSRRLVIEADSHEFHATRRGFRKDVRRYTEMVVFGWTVLRFSWEDVMLQPDFVRWAIRSWVRARDGHPVPAPPRMPGRLR
ncbi:type IV toxin-antitoxin system AbiEi family antitoxin domain-containing protein [uncultured Serinicoccus sp.]|uniref:type IV toxin-antitoxin system AbiEi family antitoxin domain-containing protein n=1 Tax=uncultured Serinicoccus sp. TaxID=735514 RepID=UPI00262F0559|nr:type IV toxin-antitoxin system AbiEi family antitoxin domain-containing protein [uncultured Serinicoccus sp.]